MQTTVIFVLPGYSPRNKEWAEEVKKHLEPTFKVHVHGWLHRFDWGNWGAEKIP